MFFGFYKKKQKINWIEDKVYHLENNVEEQEEFEIQKLRFECVKTAIQELKDKYRIIITLYLIEDYTHKEIAEQLGLKESTVRNQYVRGKQQLKQKLQHKLVL